jgi:single-strand DNA-binding protein
MNNNFIYLKGNLVKDLEQRYTAGGKPTVNGYMAVNDSYKDKEGKDVKTTVFIAFDKFGEYAGKKGDGCTVIGELRQWKNKDTEAMNFAVKAFDLVIHPKTQTSATPSTILDEKKKREGAYPDEFNAPDEIPFQ